MSRGAAIALALVIVIVAVSTGNGGSMLRSLEHGLMWGFGRSIATEIVHPHR